MIAAVAGYLGLSEILKRLHGLEENQVKLWENQNKLLEEVRSLREGQNTLLEGQNRLWEEVRSLREGQNRLWEEMKSLREGQNRLWEEVKALREGQEKLWEGQERLWKYMKTGFRDLRKALGMTFEDYARSFTELMLHETGYPEVEVGKKILVHENNIVEINLFCENPLMVGETTLNLDSAESAEEEAKRVLEKAQIVEEKFGKRPQILMISVANATQEAMEVLEKIRKERNIRLVLGKEIREFFT
ncbi:MAG: hypothetical protein ACUVQ8_08030 [Nitrososphaeria archaeon]